MFHKPGRKIVVATIVVVLVVAGAAVGTYEATSNNNSSTAPGKHSNGPGNSPRITVTGNQLEEDGAPARLIGVDLGSSTYTCLGNKDGIFGMPLDGSSISALESWHVNAIRILVNEDCWMGAFGEPHTISMSDYRKDLENAVTTFNQAHMAVILALFTNVPLTYYTKDGKATHSNGSVTEPMANSQAPAFWSSVASTFSGYPGVIFDLYGEPHIITWSCWKNGCNIGGQKYVGMQQLVNAVRSTGARQPLMLGGIYYSNNMTDWLANEPTDPDHQIVASVHVYTGDHCITATCWNDTYMPIAAKVPIVTGEFGGANCSTTFMKRYMKWADKHGISYLAWTWDPSKCSGGGFPLISSYNGTPTTYGAEYKSHLLALYNAGSGNIGSVTAGKTVSKSSKKKKSKKS